MSPAGVLCRWVGLEACPHSESQANEGLDCLVTHPLHPGIQFLIYLLKARTKGQFPVLL